MKERGIIFSAPMVRAILDGSKTQTRRNVFTKTPTPERGELLRFDAKTSVAEFGDSIPDDPLPIERRCRYGVPGDRLWVRETWASGYGRGCWGTLFAADGAFVQGKRQHQKGPHFNADDRPPIRWKPSIHIPRWASRITLEVTGVRVELVQEITEEDARAEGTDGSGPVGYIPAKLSMGACRYDFASLWDGINGKRAPWASNPFVWVVSFKRVLP